MSILVEKLRRNIYLDAFTRTYEYYQKQVAPGKGLRIPHPYLKWYDIYRSATPPSQELRQESRVDGTRASMKTGEIPDLLAYIDGQPVACCAVALHETYPVLERSRALKCIDAKPIWSIVCFFIRKQWRRQGISVQFLAAAPMQEHEGHRL